MSVSPSIQQSHQTSSDENNEINLSQQVSQQSTTNKNTVKVMSFLLFEGYSSVASDNSRYLNSRHKDKKWKNLIIFIYTEPSIMFYSNVFLMICSIILMATSDKYISNLDITRTFLNLESNKPIFLSLYSGFIMMSLCICGLYGALNVRRKLCYWVSAVMIISALFQFRIGITLINRKADQEIVVKKEMKLSFLSYSIQSEITKHWNEFQSELFCCGLYGVNSYRAKQLQIPESCYKHKDIFENWEKDFHVGCFNVVKKLEAKYLNPVIILTFFCSFLQMTNALLILNLLKPKLKPRRYHIACRSLS